MFSRIEFCLTEAFLSLRRHTAMAFAATVCVASTLFIAGIVGLVFMNTHYAVQSVVENVRFVVYFQPETERDTARDLCDQVNELPQVASATFVPKEIAWGNLKKDDPELSKLVQKNPYPDSIVVKPVTPDVIPKLKEEIEQWAEVAKVQDNQQVSSVLLRGQRVISTIGTIMGIILALLSLVIIHHTIELTLYARRKEIHIMTLVGATPGTVAMPFLLEGIVYGIIGGGVALGGLAVLYHAAVVNMANDFNTHLLQHSPMLSQGTLGILVVGVVLGLTGSTISVIKYLHRPRSKVTNA